MDAATLVLEQHSFVEEIVRGFVLGDLGEEQLRAQPRAEQNALAWLLWHAARWEDVVVNTWVAAQPQVLDEDGWLARLGVTGRRVGTAMTAEECAVFNRTVDVAGLRAYWEAVGQRSRMVLRSLPPDAWTTVVPEARLRAAAPDEAMSNPRAPWLDQFFANRTTAWLLAFLNVHNAEHLIGEALCVRSQAGVPLGL